MKRKLQSRHLNCNSPERASYLYDVPRQELFLSCGRACVCVCLESGKMINVLHARHLYFRKEDGVDSHTERQIITVSPLARPPRSVPLLIQFDPRTLSRTPAGVNQPRAPTLPLLRAVSR